MSTVFRNGAVQAPKALAGPHFLLSRELPVELEGQSIDERATPGLLSLGEDILFELCDLLEPDDITRLRRTCKSLNDLSRERLVWIRTFRRLMKEHRIPDSRVFFQPANVPIQHLESLVTRSRRLAKTLAMPNPAATAQTRTHQLRFPKGFVPQCISNVVYGRWLAVNGYFPVDNPYAIQNGQVIIFDLGMGQTVGTGLSFAKLSLPFVGRGELVDLAPLPDTNLAFLGFSYSPPGTTDESMYQIHVINLAPDAFGVVPSFDWKFSTMKIADVSLCRDMLALDIEGGFICLANWTKRTIGTITCTHISSGAGTKDKAIQLIPGGVLLADTWHTRAYLLPLIGLVDAVVAPPPIAVEPRQLAILPLDERHARSDLYMRHVKGEEDRPTPSVHFLRPPIDHLHTGSATLFVSHVTQHLVHFSTRLQVFGEQPSFRETLPLAPYSHIFALAQVQEKIAVITRPRDFLAPSSLAVATTNVPHHEGLHPNLELRPQDAPFHLAEERHMEDIEYTQDISRPLLHCPFIAFQPHWRVMNGTLAGHPVESGSMKTLIPATKRTGIVVDEIGARMVLLESRADGDVGVRVRIVEYD